MNDEPDVTMPSTRWIRAQEVILLFGQTLREIAANSDDPIALRLAVNALIRGGMQSTFLSEEL